MLRGSEDDLPCCLYADHPPGVAKGYWRASRSSTDGRLHHRVVSIEWSRSDHTLQHASRGSQKVRYGMDGPDVELGHDGRWWPSTTVRQGLGKITRAVGVYFGLYSQEFDAVVMASGHYNAPRIPDIEGLEQWKERWPDRVQHSKGYRKPDVYKGQVRESFTTEFQRADTVLECSSGWCWRLVHGCCTRARFRGCGRLSEFAGRRARSSINYATSERSANWWYCQVRTFIR